MRSERQMEGPGLQPVKDGDASKSLVGSWQASARIRGRNCSFKLPSLDLCVTQDSSVVLLSFFHLLEPSEQGLLLLYLSADRDNWTWWRAARWKFQGVEASIRVHQDNGKIRERPPPSAVLAWETQSRNWSSYITLPTSRSSISLIKDDTRKFVLSVAIIHNTFLQMMLTSIEQWLHGRKPKTSTILYLQLQTAWTHHFDHVYTFSLFPYIYTLKSLELGSYCNEI